MDKEIKLGDLVTWTIQAQGCSKTKVGVVVEIVPENCMPSRDEFPKLYTGAGVGSPRNHESYVVSVDVGRNKKGVTFREYWPRVSALEKVEIKP